MESIIFRIALILSLLFHILFFTRLSYSNIHYLYKPVKKIEVIYQIIKPKVVKASRSSSSKLHAINSKPQKIILKKEIKNASFIKDLARLKFPSFPVEDKEPVRLKDMESKNKVKVPPIRSENMNSPIYLNYYQIIRRIIKEKAITNFHKQDEGEVYLTFVIGEDGKLRQLRLIEERTRASNYLKEIGIKSIQEANPFPPFPKDLHYPELSFNVIIYFETD